MTWVTVCAAGDLGEGGLVECVHEGEPIAVARTSGELFAFAGWCTHEECPLWEGTLIDHEVECYCHGSLFDVRTGEALIGPAVESLRTYPVREAGDMVEVRV
jgi:3-phenylpropionate/trans-cinnamate dioxygenase ferredoxin subunit